MKCDVIKDLIPLYIDNCCSEESKALVEEHIKKCPDCNSLFEEMKAPAIARPIVPAPKKLKSVNSWNASVLQSLLLFVSFALITIGVAFEAYTPTGNENGDWAFSLVIPATGFMLSLANWYFVRFYKSKKAFSCFSSLATLVITVGAYIWAVFHYTNLFKEIFEISLTINFFDLVKFLMFVIPSGVVSHWQGLLLTIFFCVCSKLLSNKYATMLGKE